MSGVVTLTGSVETYTQKYSEHAACAAPFVTKVEDRLVVTV